MGGSSRLEWGSYWDLDPQITFLNHGSFGACPRAVLDEQTRLRREMEAEPVLFFTRLIEPRWDAARRKLANFAGCSPAELVMVPNATWGVNSVLRSLRLGPGDELLVTDHTYNACRNAVDFVARRDGAKVKVARLPFPVATGEQLTDAVLEAVTSRTRLALLDHVTSPSSIVLPVETLVAELNRRGVDSLIDGAHAPGMLPLSIERIRPTYYAANCHKWLCCPKGAGFLYVDRDRQQDVRPLSISHGANSSRTDRSRYWLEFDWTGTFDPTPYLCIPTAIDHLESLVPGGWPGVMRRNRDLALAARELLRDELGVEPLVGADLTAAMVTLPFPGAPSGDVESLHDELFDRHNIQVVVNRVGERTCFRISAMLYNDLDDYARLADALRTLA